MSDWSAMQTLTDAHNVGMEKLASLESAIVGLRAGDVENAKAVFTDTVAFFEEELRMHFRHEEQALFPALGRMIGRAGPIDAMLQEHESLWRAVDAFVEAVAELVDAKEVDEHTIARLEKVARHIVYLLSSHIKQEDTMLFPLAEKTLDSSGKHEVDDSVSALDRMYGTGT